MYRFELFRGVITKVAWLIGDFFKIDRFDDHYRNSIDDPHDTHMYTYVCACVCRVCVYVCRQVSMSVCVNQCLKAFAVPQHFHLSDLQSWKFSLWVTVKHTYGALN